MLLRITTGLSQVSRATAVLTSSSRFTSSSSVRFRHSSRTSAVNMRSIETRPWSIITMPPPSARTMPSTTATSTGSLSTNLKSGAGVSSRFTSVILCRHDEKHLLINAGFAGRNRLMPFFNRSNNDDLILAIQSAGVSRGRNGFFASKAPKAMTERTKASEPSVRCSSRSSSDSASRLQQSRGIAVGCRSRQRQCREYIEQREPYHLTVTSADNGPLTGPICL